MQQYAVCLSWEHGRPARFRSGQDARVPRHTSELLQTNCSLLLPSRERCHNFAFIDAQNLHLGVQRLGWKLDYRRFRIYLAEKYAVTKAMLFLGYLPSQKRMYQNFRKQGYSLIFKPVLEQASSPVKGNVDADLVLHAMLEYSHYEKAVIISSDGDFASLIRHLYSEEKLATVISPEYRTCSILLKKAARERIVFMKKLQRKLAYKQGKGTA